MEGSGIRVRDVIVKMVSGSVVVGKFFLTRLLSKLKLASEGGVSGNDSSEKTEPLVSLSVNLKKMSDWAGPVFPSTK